LKSLDFTPQFSSLKVPSQANSCKGESHNGDTKFHTKGVTRPKEDQESKKGAQGVLSASELEKERVSASGEELQAEGLEDFIDEFINPDFGRDLEGKSSLRQNSKQF
jgi:hypothetical protein